MAHHSIRISWPLGSSATDCTVRNAPKLEELEGDSQMPGLLVVESQESAKLLKDFSDDFYG
jgi:hypothetical protein